MVLNRRGGRNFGVFMLFAQIMQFGVENIPPVTLVLLAGQSAIFLGVFPKIFPSATAVCMSSYLVFVHQDWRRMILGTFYHASDMHLYFNMISLLYKGSMLERKFGSVYYAYLIGVFSALTSMTYVGLGMGLSHVLQDQSYLLSCAVGFSGVLFGMKVLTTYYSPPGMQYVFGFIPFPYKYIYWLELVLIQLVTPNASFVGHLAGILVGVCYTYGPLKLLMDSFFSPGEGMSRQASFDGRTPPRLPSPFGSRLFGRGSPQPPSASSSTTHSTSYAGGRPSSRFNQNPNSLNDYTGGLSEDEQFRRASMESRNTAQSQSYDGNFPGAGGFRSAANESPRSSQSQDSPRLYPDLTDLRTRRTNFYK